MLYHVYEHLEHSWCQRHRRSIQSPQQSFGCVELEVAKFVDVSRGRLHRGFRIISEKIQRELKTFIRHPAFSTTRKFGSDLACAEGNKNPQKQ